MTPLTGASPLVDEAQSSTHVRIDGASHTLPLEVTKQLIIILKNF